MASLFDTRIHMHDPLEVAYWASLFGVSIQELCFAIVNTGPQVGEVAVSLSIVPATPKERTYPSLSPYLLPAMYERSE